MTQNDNNTGDIAQSNSGSEGEPETVVPNRTNPRRLVDPVVDTVDLIERGKWKVTASGAVYADVMVGGLYMEGYRIGAIKHVESDTFSFEVIENYDLEDKERYLETDT